MLHKACTKPTVHFRTLCAKYWRKSAMKWSAQSLHKAWCTDPHKAHRPYSGNLHKASVHRPYSIYDTNGLGPRGAALVSIEAEHSNDPARQPAVSG